MPEKTTSSNFHYLDWPVENVLALTTTRHHPLGEDRQRTAQPFNYFNLGLHVGDSLEQVEKNRQVLLEYLPSNSRIQWLEQVHGGDVAEVTQYRKTPYVADAAFTREKGIALAVMTADCLPILLAAKNGSEVAAIHGGWRPLAGNIIERTVQKLNSLPGELNAWLGPCIGATAFEVGEEVRQAFLNQNKDFILAFMPAGAKGKYLADLHRIATIQLKQLGINKLSSKPDCTYSMPQDYYSYRRDGQTGRMASLITCL